MKLQRSEPQSKHIKNWHGRKSTQWAGSIKDLRKEIPRFTREPFRIKQGVNEYKALIVREPLEVGADLGYAGANLEYDEATTSERIPIEAVETKGYKLVEHYDMLEAVLATLDQFAPASDIANSESPKAESLEATMLLSIYGARMFIEFFAHHYKRDSYTLKVSCRNSVDKSMALTINLSLHRGQDMHRGQDIRDIPFDGFHHNHTKALSDDAIKGFLSIGLQKFLCGSWATDSANRDDLNPIIGTLSPDERRAIEWILDNEDSEDPGRVNLQRFRGILASLFHEGVKQFPDEYSPKLARLTAELMKLADKAEGTKK